MSVVTRNLVKLGFPPRPTTGGEPRISAYEIATPKLNGMRVLMDRNGNVFNRHGQPFTKMNRWFRHDLHDLLLGVSDKYVQWWDMEYVVHQDMVAIIDVCDGSDADYHARRKLVDINNECNPLEHIDKFGPHQMIKGMRKSLWKFPLYTTQMDAMSFYRMMSTIYQNVGDDYLWEGVVSVDTTQPYRLTRKQSMNMEMHRKYKFRQ